MVDGRGWDGSFGRVEVCRFFLTVGEARSSKDWFWRLFRPAFRDPCRSTATAALSGWNSHAVVMEAVAVLYVLKTNPATDARNLRIQPQKRRVLLDEITRVSRLLQCLGPMPRRSPAEILPAVIAAGRGLQPRALGSNTLTQRVPIQLPFSCETLYGVWSSEIQSTDYTPIRCAEHLSG